MTAATATVDRLGMTPAMIGRRTRDFDRYNDEHDGIWSHTGYTWCAAEAPGSNGACSRPRGHAANIPHVAATSETILFVWGGPPQNGDPHAAVRANMHTKEIPGWDDETSGFFGDRANHQTAWCMERHTDTGYVCSRPKGHDTSWQHIAANQDRVVATWGGEGGGVDRWGHIKVGDRVTHFDGWDSRESGDWLYRAGHNSCGYTEAEVTHHSCRRAHEHSGQHVIADDGGHVLWVGGGTSSVTDKLELQDPEDGTPADPDDVVFTTLPEVGELVRLRDRQNRLYVMSHRATGKEIEALDLHTKELRAIPLDRCVKTGSTLTTDELQWVVQWYANYRKQVRKIAVREYRNDRWCMAGLNQNLGSLGLERYEPTLRGTITVQVPFEWPNTQAKSSEIERIVLAALQQPEVAAAMRLALPSIEGMELEPESLKVSATNFMRK